MSGPKKKMGDLDFAMKFRDVIRSIVRREINSLRPAPKFGRVIDFNRAVHTAEVLLVGDTSPTKVKVTRGVQPTRRDIIDGDGNGDFVRIEGQTGNQWITAVLSGPTFMETPNLHNPRIVGGKLLDRTICANFAMTVDLPAAGNSIYLGRFDNESADADGLATITAVVQQWGQAWVSKYYIINILPFDTGGSWKRLTPNGYTERHSGNDFHLEINTPDDHSFELRVRRTAGGSETGGYDFAAQVYGQNWVLSPDHDPYEDTDPSPSMTHGIVPVTLSASLGTRAGGYETPAYRRGAAGVSLQGCAANVSGSTLSTNFVMFTMPEGLRPRNRRPYACAYSGGRADIDVFPDGKVQIAQALGSTGWVSLEGVLFPPEQ